MDAFLTLLRAGEAWVGSIGELPEHILAGYPCPCSILLLGRGHRRLNEVVIWRPLAHGVRSCRIAGQGKGLAAASAKILEAPVAASTRFWHPVEASELVKGGGLAPYPAQAIVSHVLEVERTNGAGRRTRECRAVGGDDEVNLPPAAHAGLGEGFVVIGPDPDKLHSAFEVTFLPFIDRLGPQYLVLCRQQTLAVQECPTIVLTVGQFQAFGAPRGAQIDDLVKLIEVETVQHDVHAESKACAADDFGCLRFLLVGPSPSNPIVEVGGRRLNAQLDVVQAAGSERLGPLSRKSRSAGNQIGVELQLAATPHQRLKVRSKQRLAAGKMELDNAEGLRLF